MRRPFLILTVGATLAAAITLGVWETRGMSAVKFETPYQAVLLDNGQVYYGKVQGLGTAFPVLTDVYYVEHQVNQQTKDVKNILRRRGTEWHEPDRMVVNANHVVLVEPVSPTSKVAELIADLKTQNR
jgi:hypothetical protein